jgi:hypothetical protein
MNDCEKKPAVGGRIGGDAGGAAPGEPLRTPTAQGPDRKGAPFPEIQARASAAALILTAIVVEGQVWLDGEDIYRRDRDVTEVRTRIGLLV